MEHTYSQHIHLIFCCNLDTSTVYDVKWLKQSLQRSTEQAEEEGRSLEEVVADRWGVCTNLVKLAHIKLTTSVER